MFSEVNALREWSFSQKEATLKFSQVEGNVKAFLVNLKNRPCAFCLIMPEKVFQEDQLTK